MPNYYIDGDMFLIETYHQFAVYDFRKKALQPNSLIVKRKRFGLKKFKFSILFRLVALLTKWFPIKNHREHKCFN